MASKVTKKSKGARPGSSDFAEGVGSDKTATVTGAFGSPGETPTTSKLSTQPRTQTKDATKDRSKRRSKSKGARAETATSAIKTALETTTLEPSTSHHTSTAASFSASAAAVEAKEITQQQLPTEAPQGGPSQQNKLSTTPETRKLTAVSQRTWDDSTKEPNEAVKQEELPPDACESTPARASGKTSTTRTSRALSLGSTASKAASTWTKEESMKALNELLNAGMGAVSNKLTLSPPTVPSGLKSSKEAKVFAIMLLVGVVVAFTVFLLPSPVPKTALLCSTQSCAQHRALIELQLDMNVDPCKDFTAHVCSRWEPRKEFADMSRSVLTDMVMSWLARVPDTLAEGLARLPAGRKASAMFNSCMTQTGSQVDVWKNFMSEHGLSWPEDPPENATGNTPVEVLFDLAFNWNVNLWFSLNVLPSAADDGHKRRLFFSANNLMLEWRTIFRQIPRQFFDRVYSAIFKLFGKDQHISPPPERIKEAYSMLLQIFDVFISSSVGNVRVPAVMPLRELDKVITQLTNAAYLKYVIDGKLKIEPPFTMEDLLLTSDLDLLDATLQIFGKFNDSSVRRNLAWLFLEAYAAVANPDAVLLILHGSQRRANQVRTLFCAGQVEASYKVLVAAMAAVTYFTDEERRIIDAKLANIVQTAVEKASAVPWLDNGTKGVAAEKLRTVRSVLWPDNKFLTAEGLEEAYTRFPESAPSFAHFWIETRRSLRGLIGSDVGLQQLRIGESTAQPYAQYVHVLNQLSLSLGALAPPLYYKEGTKAMLYGGVGYLYAMELVGAVDSEGVKVDPMGNIVSSWLSEAVKSTFKDRVLGCLPGGNPNLFPEVPAIEVAFAAFKNELRDDDLQLSLELTEEKVFFITACLLSCSKTPDDNLYGGDCNKAMANFAPFAEAFQCRPGSNLNPITKCSFFD